MLNLVIHLVSGFGLLSVTGLIIDTLALYVLTARVIYSKYIYEYSPDLDKNIKQN